MLKQIPAMLSPDLVKVLMEMGHGDEIVIADGNFPGASHASHLIRCDGLTVPQLLKELLVLFPLDKSVDRPVGLMEVSEEESYEPVIWEEYKKILKDSGEGSGAIEYIERFKFYDRSKESYAIVSTSEKALYANILLRKGVVK